ncbi:hypothetical protein TA3x_002938 [Tundrisphaera sp. TA3]|uniref:hypothetical protein n=1 Tax=Tundrisphaera sp. TA3 TaxID=3435775 RepID=UPI003EB8F01D
MTTSIARLEANRRNALRSTGPRTDAGKSQSRRNALKHGLTGDGVVLLEEDAAEVEALSARLESEMQPAGTTGRLLIRRMALLWTRLDRCGRHDLAMTARRARDARKAREDARAAEVNDIAANLANDPEVTVRRLMRTPEGVDGLIETWMHLRGSLDSARLSPWSDRDDRQVEYLQGRHPGMHPPSPFEPLLLAMRGDFSGLTQDQGAGLGRKDRKLWARGQVAALIDAEVAELRALRELVDDEDEAADRAEAPERALFDPSAEAHQARKYEAAAERGLFRALREYQNLETPAQAAPMPATAPPPPPAPRDEPRAARPPASPPPVASPRPTHKHRPASPPVVSKTKPTAAPTGVPPAGVPG